MTTTETQASAERRPSRKRALTYLVVLGVVQNVRTHSAAPIFSATLENKRSKLTGPEALDSWESGFNSNRNWARLAVADALTAVEDHLEQSKGPNCANDRAAIRIVRRRVEDELR